MNADTQAGLLNRPTKIELLVLQPTGFCNIDCSYCYLPGRDNKRRMSDEVFQTIVDDIIPSDRFSASSLLLWHAGEPLAVPLGWYQDAYAKLTAAASIPVKTQFQTNGTLIDHKWALFLKENNASVGLSIDGPPEVHDFYRKDRKARGTFNQTIAGLEILREHDVPFTIISTVTDRSLEYPDQMYDLMEKLRPASWGLSVEETEGANTSSTVYNHGAAEKVAEFFFKIAKRNFASRDPLRIREIDYTLQALTRASSASAYGGVPHSQETKLGSIVSIGVDGAVSFFSPELLTSQKARKAGAVAGNITTHTLEQLITSASTKKQEQAIAAGAELCRSTCEYFDFCGGGSPANKLTERGRYDISETWQCIVAKQAVTRGVLAAISPQG